MSLDDSLKSLIGIRWLGAAARRREGRLGFFGIGVQKGGTTTLDELLRLHPDIELPLHRKELHYFDANRSFGPDHRPSRGDYSDLHRSFYFDRKITGEITPTYIYWRNGLERIKAYNRDARIVVLLRNPVLRAYSQWGHLKRKSTRRKYRDLEVEPFLKRLALEERALRKHPGYQNRRLSYVARSRYAPQIAQVRALFPREQVLFIKSERFFADQHAAADEVCGFLGVGPLSAIAPPSKIHANVGTVDPISIEEWEAVIGYFDEDIAAVERELGWDCSDWRKPPPAKQGRRTTSIDLAEL
jgi:hypothetical protein